jgi:hypothetical protein
MMMNDDESMEAKPNINVVNNFHFLEESSKLMSSSMEAKPKIKESTFFNRPKLTQWFRGVGWMDFGGVERELLHAGHDLGLLC